MATRRALEAQLSTVSGFVSPTADLEQYPTPPEIAASLIHVADMQGDLDRAILDLGSGTGVLSIGCGLRSDSLVVGIERDQSAIATAVENAAQFADETAIQFVRGDARSPPVSFGAPPTVVMNPPFGAQSGRDGADKAFLAAAREVGAVSYSIHNGGSRSFIEAYADDHGGEITHAYELELDIDRQFSFHDDDRRAIAAEAYRIVWADGLSGPSTAVG